MSNEVNVTIVGRLTDDPVLRFTNSGSPVVNFSVAQNSRRFDKTKNEWVDSEPTYYRCSLWSTSAENVAETLRKGTGVVVYGVQGTRSWETNGEKKSAMEVKVERIGLDLSFVKVDPANIVASRGNSGHQAAAPAAAQAPAGGSAGDPWASDPAVAVDEPPF